MTKQNDDYFKNLVDQDLFDKDMERIAEDEYRKIDKINSRTFDENLVFEPKQKRTPLSTTPILISSPTPPILVSSPTTPYVTHLPAIPVEPDWNAIYNIDYSKIIAGFPFPFA